MPRILISRSRPVRGRLRTRPTPTRGSCYCESCELHPFVGRPFQGGPRRSKAPRYEFSAYHVAEHAVGFHFASFGSFLNWELITKGCRRYRGSVVMIVT